MAKKQETERIYHDEDSTFFESQSDKFNLLLVTVTPIEMNTLHNVMQPLAGKEGLVKIHKGSQSYFLGMFGCYPAIHVNCDNMGSSDVQGSQATTTDAIAYCKPKAVVMMGIAMGASTKHKIGDVLISETIVLYESQRIGADSTISRAKTGQASIILLNRFKQQTGWNHKINKKTPSIIPGEILSGEKLVDNIDFKKELLNGHPNAKGLEMEGFGVYVASYRSQVHWIVVKAICDYGDGEKKKQKEIRQKVAASSSTNLCRHVFNSPNAFKDLGLIPTNNNQIEVVSNEINANPIPKPSDVEQKILVEMATVKNNIPPDLNESLQEIVRTYLNIGDIEKTSIAKKIGIFDEKFNALSPDERDVEFFTKAAENNLLAEIWDLLNPSLQLENKTNPFNSVNQ